MPNPHGFEVQMWGVHIVYTMESKRQTKRQKYNVYTFALRLLYRGGDALCLGIFGFHLFGYKLYYKY